MNESGSSLILVWVEETMRECFFSSYLLQFITHLIFQLFVLLSAAVSRPKSSTASHCRKQLEREVFISVRNNQTLVQNSEYLDRSLKHK